jgi:hypothetical protein
MAEAYSRTEHVSFNSHVYNRQYNKKLGTDTTSDQVATPFKGVNTMSGIKNPKWRDAVRLGNNATTPLTGTFYTVDTSWCTAVSEYFRTDGNGFEQYGAEFYGYPNYSNVLSSTPPAPASTVTAATNRAIRKFLSKAESVRSSVEAGQDFGEYKETLHGLTSPVSELRKHVLGYFPKVKKLSKRFKNALSLEKALADTYLEWSFGWKPLAEDIAQAYVGLQNRSRFSDRQAIRVSSKELFPCANTTTYNLSSFGGLGTIQQSSRIVGEYIVCIYGMIRTGANTDGLVSRAQTLQLDLPHFVPTIWDLIPYSFIVDYFVNVGDIINALSVVNSTFIWGGQDIISNYVHDFSDITIAYNAQPPYVTRRMDLAKGGHARFTRRDTSRFIFTPAGLLPEVQFHIPLSEKPWENMGAILTSHIANLVPLR